MKANWMAGVAAAFFAAAAMAGVSGEDAMKALDANGDGIVSATEAEANPDLAREFGKYDSDGDGQLDRGEFSRFETIQPADDNMQNRPDEETDSGDTG